MSTRLTNDIREKILFNVTLDTFTKREENIQKAEKKIGDALYALAVPDSELEKMKALPDGFFETTERISITNDCRIAVGLAADVGRYGADGNYDMSEARLIPAMYRFGSVDIPKNGQLFKRLVKYAKSQKKLQSDQSEFEKETRKLLWSVTTAKKLLEVWPEGEKYIPITSTGNAVAITSEKVTKLMSCMKDGTCEKDS